MLTLHDKGKQTEKAEDIVLVPVRPVLVEEYRISNLAQSSTAVSRITATTYQRIILVVAGLRHQRQTAGIQLQARGGLLALRIRSRLKRRRALLDVCRRGSCTIGFEGFECHGCTRFSTKLRRRCNGILSRELFSGGWCWLVNTAAEEGKNRKKEGGNVGVLKRQRFHCTIDRR